MGEIRLNIDGREVTGFSGQTVLAVAAENGITIPTLCDDARVKMYGSCGVCVVEAEGSPKLLRSCSTYAADDMIIATNTEKVRKSRKTALELLLSDHIGDCRPPCVLACPAQTDCQGYVGLIANGEYKEALKLVKDKIPLPGSIGRVCPHPCEDACRREMVEEPVSIAALKTFVANKDMQSDKLYTAETGEATGKRVAVIGGGPGGLSAAYFLRIYGHDVTIYDAMPNMGGMLRYGIPEYRLPKSYLQEEVSAIERMGVTFKNNIKVGRDVSLAYVKEKFDAVILAVGAWTSTPLNCKGKELDGVIDGIDFLRGVAMNTREFTGRRIAVVGGGNTAMDACRTAIRLGAEMVYNVYRRTKDEMPAEKIEILEAEEEGFIFKGLTNPNEIIGKDGKVSAVTLQIMELGEPDASGRRAPVPVPGKEETIEVDAVIVAIGQKLDPAGLDGIELTRWGTIATDEHTFRTSTDGIFAIGDATNNGADIAITAIGEAKKAAVMVDKYLNGEKPGLEAPYLVKTNPGPEDFKHIEKQPRAKMPHREAAERRGDFLEINYGLLDSEAKREANRCLECGCMDYFECKLIDYANQYRVSPEKFDGETHIRRQDDDHPYIRRNPDKCILCGLCVRICDEVVGATALGLVDRGFDTIVKPSLDMKLKDTDCISCGQCVSVCPTGALTEKMMIQKQVPVREFDTLTTCAFCSVGCMQRLCASGDMLTRALPAAKRGRDALLCVKGRFGFGELKKLNRLKIPLIKQDGKFVRTDYAKAVVYVNKKLQALQTRYGTDSIAVTISDRYTNEEAFLIREYAFKALGLQNVFSFSKTKSGVSHVIGRDCSTADFEELQNTDCILLVETNLHKPHVIAGLHIRKAAENGAKVIAVNSFDSPTDDIATLRLNPGDSLSVLKQFVKAALEAAKDKSFTGFDELARSLESITVSDEVKVAAEVYLKAKKAVIVFPQAALSQDAARLLADLAVLSGHIDKPRSGIIQLKPNANSQGLTDMGALSRDALRGLAGEKIKGMFIFGEDAPDFDLSGIEFIAVQDLTLTETAKKADVVFPAESFAEVCGTFTNTVGKLQDVRASVPSFLERSNFELIADLKRQAYAPLRYRSVEDIAKDVIALRESLIRGEIRLLAADGDALHPERESINPNVLYANMVKFLESEGI